MGKSIVSQGRRRRSLNDMISKVLIEDQTIPPNAVPFGEDRNGHTFFIARAHLEVSLQP